MVGDALLVILNSAGSSKGGTIGGVVNIDFAVGPQVQEVPVMVGFDLLEEPWMKALVLPEGLIQNHELHEVHHASMVVLMRR